MNHWLDRYISDHNATLLSGEFPKRSIDGCIISDEWEHFIVVDSRLDIQHTRFTIAHEIGHLAHNSIGNASKWDEQDADDFAIHLLVTDSDLKNAMEDGHNDIPTLSIIFGVPYKWMEKRLQKFFNK